MYNNQEKLQNNRISAMNSFLSEPTLPTSPDPNDPNVDCSSGVCILKNDKSIVERMNKKIITEDGRQLLI